MATESSPTGWDSIPHTIEVIFAGINKTAGNMATQLVDYGGSLTLTLSALLISWNMLLIMLDGEDILGTVKQLFKTLFVCGVVMMCITSYNTYFNKIIPESFDQITTTVTGGQGIGIDPKARIVSTASLFVGTIKNLVTFNDALTDQLDKNAKKGVQQFTTPGLEMSGEATTERVKGGFNVAKTVADATGWQMTRALSIIFRLLAGLIVGVAMIIAIAIIAIGLVKKAIAIALGPVFIPWILFEPASFLFSGWLRFYLGSLVYLLVAIVLLNIMMEVPKALQEHIAMVASQEYMYALAAEIVGIFTICILYVLMAYVMWQVPTIAAGLTGGVNISLGNLIKGNPVVGALPGGKPSGPPPPGGPPKPKSQSKQPGEASPRDHQSRADAAEKAKNAYRRVTNNQRPPNKKKSP